MRTIPTQPTDGPVSGGYVAATSEVLRMDLTVGHYARDSVSCGLPRFVHYLYRVFITIKYTTSKISKIYYYL